MMQGSRLYKLMGGELLTPDLYFTAYLQTMGIAMTTTVRQGSRLFFVFPHTPQTTQLTQSWLSDGPVPAFKFALQVKMLKSLLHNVP
jgi:hypothetical protein